MVSPVIPLSPMPGGALTANTMMMRDTGTLHLFKDVIKEMSEVVRKGGFGTSVTPVSQFYFQQAYLNVTQGRWKKIWKDYGDMVLGYFGRTPVAPDPEVVKLAEVQLGKPFFSGDPLDLLDPGIPKAKKILEDNNLPVTDENIFILASCEKKGLDYLQGKSEVNIRFKEHEDFGHGATIRETGGARSYSITVEGKTYDVLVEEGSIMAAQAKTAGIKPVATTIHAPTAATHDGQAITAPTPGIIVKLRVKEGDQVEKDQTVVEMEAMKMVSEVRAPKAGLVIHISVAEGESVQTGDALLTLG